MIKLPLSTFDCPSKLLNKSLLLSKATNANQIITNNTLKPRCVSFDVRADNGAWNSSLQSVKLIDWNWAQISDRRIDINSLLVHVYRSGYDVTNQYADWLNADVLQWLAGFWLLSAAEKDAFNTSENARLGDYQLLSGIAALELRSKLISE